MTNEDVVRIAAPAVSEKVRQRVALTVIIALAAALRIYAISLYPLAGDEYGSLAEAKAVGLNWNSILYSSLMHFWVRLGSSEFWLRLPAAIFGVATVAVLFKVGEKLGGWRTGLIVALLAAMSPFGIYHSQEMRFYSLFMLATSAFMVATMTYLERPHNTRNRVALLLTGIVLIFSHFLGLVAVYAQVTSTVIAAKKERSRRNLTLLLFGLPIVASALVLSPAFRHALWRIYHSIGNAPSSIEPVMTPVSILNFVKTAFAFFVFTFGYHVYPLRLVLVIPAVLMVVVALLLGTIKLWRDQQWRTLPFAYLLALIAVYFVLDAAGGRVANGVSPRHVAFVWPAFVVLTALGVSTLKRPLLYVAMAAILIFNTASIGAAWQKDWTYGGAVDYRAAADYASRSANSDTAILHDGRSKDEINFYFPSNLTRISSWPYVQNPDSATQISNARIIFVTDDWEPGRRHDADRLMNRLTTQYKVVDGYVDYPLFEYVLERKPTSGADGFGMRAQSNQVDQPLSNYGLEFQDLRLPQSVKFRDVQLSLIGAYGLPDLEGRKEFEIPLAQTVQAKRVALLTTVVGAAGLKPEQNIGEVTVEDNNGELTTVPLRYGKETTSWESRCEPSSSCETIFQWHKRVAIVGQNRYEGAFRDFSAGLHGFAAPFTRELAVKKVTVRYSATVGQLYVWGIALPAN